MALEKETLDSLQEVAIVVQFVSMFLEISGISLAFVELRFRPLAVRLENWIGVADYRSREFAYSMIQHKWFSILVTLFIFVVFFFEIPYLFTDFFDEFPGLNVVQDILFWLTLPIVALFGLGILMVLLSAWISSLNKFSNGHAIGALGVFIASMGLMGEAFQVVVIFLTWNAENQAAPIVF